MAIITITRGVQSGGRELAHQLADRLGYSCLSREVVAQCARKYNIMEQELYEKLMEAPGLWKRLSREHSRYLIYIQCSLVEAALQDNVIYHGYAGHLFLQGIQHALKVRLEAPFEERVEAEVREYSKDREEASDYIKKVDEQRNNWVKYLYGKEWQDPSFYDLSINLQNMSIETVCDMVALALKTEEFQTTPESINGLNNLSLECEVMAAIASDDELWDQSITVTAAGSVVTIRGQVPNARIRDGIVDTASKVKGVTHCRVYISLPTDPLHGGMYGHD